MIVKGKLKVSTSALKTYEKCPREYYYKYIEKPEVEKKDWSHLRIGNFAHAVLDDFHSKLKENPSQPWPELMSFLCKEKVSNYNLNKDEKKVVKDMLNGYLTKLQQEGLPNVIATEKSFSIALDENTIIKGVIDRIDDETEDPGTPKYHIKDYKSGRAAYLDEFQLLVYGLYLLDTDPNLEKFKGSYTMLAEGSRSHMVSIFTKTDLDRVKDKIIKVANDIRSDQTWEPKPQFLCKYCDYNKICPSSPFKEVSGGRKEW